MELPLKSFLLIAFTTVLRGAPVEDSSESTIAGIQPLPAILSNGGNASEIGEDTTTDLKRVARETPTNTNEKTRNPPVLGTTSEIKDVKSSEEIIKSPSPHATTRENTASSSRNTNGQDSSSGTRKVRDTPPSSLASANDPTRKSAPSKPPVDPPTFPSSTDKKPLTPQRALRDAPKQTRPVPIPSRLDAQRGNQQRSGGRHARDIKLTDELSFPTTPESTTEIRA